MPRETVEQKGLRYIGERRVHIERVGADTVTATCRGDASYRVTFEAGRWRCSCPAWRTCSHLVAVQLVTTPASVVDESVAKAA